MFDFSQAAAVTGWVALDDRVMGGVSRSQLRYDPAGWAVFEGHVSLAQGGGFASVRSPLAHWGLAGAQACEVEVAGDGRVYKLNLITANAPAGSVYQAELAMPDTGWHRLHMSWRHFELRWRGRPVPDRPALDPAQINQAGLMVSGRQAGAFCLRVRRLALV